MSKNDKAILVEDQTIYQKLNRSIQNIYFEVHAIYEPEGSEGFEQYHCAGVDLFKPGNTYRIYFEISDAGEIDVKHLSKWFFG